MFFHLANISWLEVILEVFMMALSIMKLSICVLTKAKQINSHFPNFGEVILVISLTLDKSKVSDTDTLLALDKS